MRTNIIIPQIILLVDKLINLGQEKKVALPGVSPERSGASPGTRDDRQDARLFIRNELICLVNELKYQLSFLHDQQKDIDSSIQTVNSLKLKLKNLAAQSKKTQDLLRQRDRQIKCLEASLKQASVISAQKSVKGTLKYQIGVLKRENALLKYQCASKLVAAGTTEDYFATEWTDQIGKTDPKTISSPFGFLSNPFPESCDEEKPQKRSRLFDW